MKKIRRVAIIGGGVGMMSILYKMAKIDVRNCEICVYRKNTAGIGEAYKLSPDYLIMNTRNDAISFFDECINYGKWLSKNHPALSKKEEFVPRRVFGQYLLDVNKSLRSRLNRQNCIIHYDNSAARITENNQIVTERGETSHKHDVIFISIGFGCESNTAEVESVLDRVPYKGVLNIVGSGLGAIDAVISSHNYRPDIHISCFSREGMFPAVRGDFGISELSIFERNERLLKTPSLTLMFATLRKECRRICGDESDYQMLVNPRGDLLSEYRKVLNRTPAWQSMLYSGTNQYSIFFSQLSGPEKHWLMSHRPKFINRRGMFPQRNARWLLSLMDNNSLSIKSRNISLPETLKGHWLSCINSNKGIKKFLHLSKIKTDAYGGALIDKNGRAKDHRNIYVIGPATNSSRYFTEASSLTVTHCEQAVSDAFREKGNKHEHKELRSQFI
ncbi:FAD/NAD(P)-binding protein [Billgrantia endophytica]|uniref:FAD-dependent urate hydroxylase HpyO/Asp monooxygenase CreE-like FAD/NAD(P)-binding domain-containing protein n=1 Tax=Billgrantia endophytica TaxID=2033802 RepID=A0A2N7U2G0_9GAMM|nr:FAD/NAD(P)-binding protein [Halomonas endophytica]PMR74621.1 hypothetical protein C1H69_12215 [Halomonas endophytica]